MVIFLFVLAKNLQKVFNIRPLFDGPNKIKDKIEPFYLFWWSKYSIQSKSKTKQNIIFFIVSFQSWNRKILFVSMHGNKLLPWFAKVHTRNKQQKFYFLDILRLDSNIESKSSSNTYLNIIELSGRGGLEVEYLTMVKQHWM